MKSCPTCNRTFEDTFTFCLADGSLLDAPFDPHATQSIPEARRTERPPTEVLPAQEVKEEIPPTIASPQPEQKPKELASTITAPAPAFESPQIKDSPAQLPRRSGLSPLIIVGVGAFLLIALTYFITSNRADSTNRNAATINTATSNNSNSTTIVINANQMNTAATPTPTPSLMPVVNLEGTVWRLTTTIDSRDYSDATLEFKQNGRIIDHGVTMDDGNWRYNTRGKWTRQGDKVIMDFPTDPYFDHYKYEGTIQGEEITGTIEFFGKQANGTFKARLIK